jgi:signal transduction histidine kinase
VSLLTALLPGSLTMKTAAIGAAAFFVAGGLVGWSASDYIADVAQLRADLAAAQSARDASDAAARNNLAAVRQLADAKARQDAAVAELAAERDRLAADLQDARDAVASTPGADDLAGEAIDRAFDAVRKGSSR